MSQNLDDILPESLACASLHDQVFLIVSAIHGLVPDRFHMLEGFTREDGGVIFISRDPQKIRRSGSGLHALPIAGTDWYVNPAINRAEARRFFVRIARAVNLPVAVQQRIASLIR